MSHVNREYNARSNVRHYPIEVLPSLDRAPTNKSLTILLLGDFIPAAIIGLLLLLQYLFARPAWRGFYCDDESIRYPYKEETISSWLLSVLGAIFTLVMIVILECRYFVKMNAINSITFSSLTKNMQNTAPESLAAQREANKTSNIGKIYGSSRSVKINLLMVIYCRLMLFMFGVLASESITELSKYSVGRLRPYFFNVCKPMISVVGQKGIPEFFDGQYYCSQQAPAYKYLYITDYYCSGNKQNYKKQVDARLSFMSGHSSYAAYSATYASVYLQSTLTDMPILRGSMQLSLALMAYYTGLSRINDHRHHWSDVLAGLTQGILVAIMITQYLWPSYKRKWASYLMQSPEEESLLCVVPRASSGRGIHYPSERSSGGDLASSDNETTQEESYKVAISDEQPVGLSYDEFVV